MSKQTRCVSIVSLFVFVFAFCQLYVSVWAATKKDEKPVQPQATSTSKNTGVEWYREINPVLNYRTHEQRMEGLHKAKLAERSTSAYEAATGIVSESPFFTPSILTETAPENYDTAGYSYYDYNANYRNPRMIAITKTNNNVGIAWAKIATIANGPRNIYCALWKSSSKFGGNFLTDVPLSGDLVGRGGFCGVTYTPKTGRLVLYSHHAETPEGTWFGIEITAGQFDWGSDIEAPDSLPGISQLGIWPTAAAGLEPDAPDYDKDGNTTESLEVVHFFSYPNGPNQYLYGRVVDTGGIWISPGFANNIALVVDRGTWIVPTVVASKKSAKVALIYTNEDACNLTKPCSDIIYIESTNGGNDWVTAGNFDSFTRNNITNYGANDRVRAAPDLMGVYDNNDSLVISFLQYVDYDPPSGSTSLQADIMVWTKAFGIRKAVDGNFPINNLQDDTRRQTVNWPHIAVHDGTGNPSRTNYLYLVWTQFSGPTSTEQGDTNVEGFYNGDVYISCSTNGGTTWSAPINATNSHTPACPIPTSGTGTCSGVNFSSCAERANDTIHICYMTDEYPGYWSAGSGENPDAYATANEVIYMKYPAFTPTAAFRISIEPARFDYWPTASMFQDTFWVENIGNANLTVDSIRVKNGSLWLTINNGSSGFTIIEGDPAVSVVFTINTNPVSDFTNLEDTIVIYSNAANFPVMTVPVSFVIGREFGLYFMETQANGLLQRYGYNEIDSIYHSNAFVSSVPSGFQVTSQIFCEIPSFPYLLTGNGTFTFQKSPVAESFSINLDFGQLELDYSSSNNIGNSTLHETFNSTGPGKYQNITKTTTILLDTNSVETRNIIATVDDSGIVSNVRMVEHINHLLSQDNFSGTYTIKLGSDSSIVTALGTLDENSSDEAELNLTQIDLVTTTVGVETVTQLLNNTNKASAKTEKMNKNELKLTFQYDVVAPQSKVVSVHQEGQVKTIDSPGSWKKKIGEHLRDLSREVVVDVTKAVVAAVVFTKESKSTTAIAAVIILVGTTDGAVLAGVAIAGATVTKTAGTIKAAATAAGSAAAAGYVAGQLFDAFFPKKPRLSYWDSEPNELVTDSICVHAQTAFEGFGNFSYVQYSLSGCISESTLCTAKPGDANASGTYTLGDVISIVNYIFNKDGCTPRPLCWLSNLLCRGDWNGSGTVSLSDVIQAVNFIFNKPGGPWTPLLSGTCCLNP